MKRPIKAKVVRVYLNENDQFAKRMLFVALTTLLKKNNVLLTTVLRGPMGIGQNNKLRRDKLFQLSSYSPVVLEFLDRSEKINSVLPILEPLLKNHLYAIQEGELWLEEP